MRRSHIFAAAMVAAATLTLQGCTFVKVNKNFSFETEKGDAVTKEFEVQSLSRLTIHSHSTEQSISPTRERSSATTSPSTAMEPAMLVSRTSNALNRLPQVTE